MWPDHCRYLCCPACGGDIVLDTATVEEDGAVVEGSLACVGCGRRISIVRGVPRFVSSDNYSESFGFEWTRHHSTQYDGILGLNLSEERFFNETGWPADLRGEVIIEAGSGSGRFTEQAASTGAVVLSLDYSDAVDANYGNNGHRQNVLIVQGNIYSMPFKQDLADKLFCFGVLQHLPDPKGGFLALIPHLKSGGRICVDVYAINWKTPFKTYYLARPITKRIPHPTLYGLIRRYVEALWPVCRIIAKLPQGRLINRSLFMIADYTGKVAAGDEALREMAVLDTFDSLSPQYDKPQFLSTVTKWFREAGLADIDVRKGYNGIQGRAVKPDGLDEP